MNVNRLFLQPGVTAHSETLRIFSSMGPTVYYLHKLIRSWIMNVKILVVPAWSYCTFRNLGDIQFGTPCILCKLIRPIMHVKILFIPAWGYCTFTKLEDIQFGTHCILFTQTNQAHHEFMLKYSTGRPGLKLLHIQKPCGHLVWDSLYTIYTN